MLRPRDSLRFKMSLIRAIYGGIATGFVSSQAPEKKKRLKLSNYNIKSSGSQVRFALLECFKEHNTMNLPNPNRKLGFRSTASKVRSPLLCTKAFG
ncbi:hypothetical protein SUGI_1105190 [Cryptomeria japonica]|nr:hypothetical protein SUGI_1105190 [Cryptomeria japonica]